MSGFLACHARTHTLTHACTHEEEQVLTLGYRRELRETFSLPAMIFLFCAPNIEISIAGCVDTHFLCVRTLV